MSDTSTTTQEVFAVSSTGRTFTKEQLDQIAANKAKALERLKAKRKAAEANGQEQTTDKAPAPKKAKWIKSFYEYDLSTMEDSKGGFIVDETEGNKEFELEKKKRSYIIEPYFRKLLLDLLRRNVMD
jgi:DNA-repair protein complementing XP-A cells